MSVLSPLLVHVLVVLILYYISNSVLLNILDTYINEISVNLFYYYSHYILNISNILVHSVFITDNNIFIKSLSYNYTLPFILI